jgi:hypothetical protein
MVAGSVCSWTRRITESRSLTILREQFDVVLRESLNDSTQ